MRLVSQALLERLRDLSFVEVDALIAGLEGSAAVEMLQSYIADLVDALGHARGAIVRAHLEIGAAGEDPLRILDFGPEKRAQGGEEATQDSAAELAKRAAARRDLALLEEVVKTVLPRLLEADRRYLSMR